MLNSVFRAVVVGTSYVLYMFASIQGYWIGPVGLMHGGDVMSVVGSTCYFGKFITLGNITLVYCQPKRQNLINTNTNVALRYVISYDRTHAI